MTSARGRKRRTQQGRRSQKKRGSQQGRRQKSQGRSSPAKQRKRRGQAKHQPVEKQRKRALKHSFRSTNAKKLNHAKRGRRFLSHQAKGLMTNFVKDIYKQVLSEAEQLRRESHDPLVSPTHVLAALRRVMPKRRRRPTPVSRNRH